MNRRNRIMIVVAAFATAAVFTAGAAAMARIDNGATGTVEYEWVSNGYGGVEQIVVQPASSIPYLSHGVGITREASPSELMASQSSDRRAFEWVSNGYGGVEKVAAAPEIPYLSHGVGITRELPTTVAASTEPIFRDQPDGLLPREPVEVAAASGTSIDWNEVALGFGFGLALAMLGALGVLALQRTVRTQ